MRPASRCVAETGHSSQQQQQQTQAKGVRYSKPSRIRSSTRHPSHTHAKMAVRTDLTMLQNINRKLRTGTDSRQRALPRPGASMGSKGSRGGGGRSLMCVLVWLFALSLRAVAHSSSMARAASRPRLELSLCPDQAHPRPSPAPVPAAVPAPADAATGGPQTRRDGGGEHGKQHQHAHTDAAHGAAMASPHEPGRHLAARRVRADQMGVQSHAAELPRSPRQSQQRGHRQTQQAQLGEDQERRTAVRCFSACARTRGGMHVARGRMRWPSADSLFSVRRCCC